MKKKISNQFAVNYLLVFLLSVLAGLFALAIMSFASDVLSKTLTKNTYTAADVMQTDITRLDAGPVVENGGGVQVVDENYQVVFSEGLDTLGKTQLSAGEFTEFLMQSHSVGMPYHYDVAFNETGHFWLIVTFPTSIRIDAAIAINKDFISRDMENVAGAFAAVIIFYFLLLALFAFIFSRLTAMRITTPLRKLTEGTRRVKDGDYKARIDLKLNNEFAQLQETFNEMARRIDSEISLRKSAEEDRKRLVLDISHDLKNPLASAAGYAELLLKKPDLAPEARDGYLRIIHQNSLRAGTLLSDLFELAKLDSPDFRLTLSETDLNEYLRMTCAGLLPLFEQAGFAITFEIPEAPVRVLLDDRQMDRVFHNLSENAVRYNGPGTEITLRLTTGENCTAIVFKDNGIGIPTDKARDIFKPFVRSDEARNSETGGAGLGLAIAQKIIVAHGGTLTLETDKNQGCAFTISLPTI